jgi:[lysine-biosynthesis-protein LysW]--L-2-aminoadipate ligase
LAVDLFRMDGRWVINEVNGQPEFRSSTISTTGVDLAALMMQYAWSLVPEEALLVGQG